MNLPNKLTVSRFVLTIAFLAVFFSRVRYHETISLALFSIASLTDYFDGMIARRDKLITNFGILMDPLADKILICSAFIAFVDRAPTRHELEWMPAWMAVTVVARELAITGLRLLAASKNVVLSAERFGKDKTISQIVCIVSILVLASYHDWGWFGQLFAFNLFGWGPWVKWFTEVSKWVAVILTAYSGGAYLWKNRQLYLADM
ncbi:MAG: CDP-diacylglycerol--glycerol-3-phosphate 3-phosphatidyltransferase [Verrucomicrobiota bacterium]